MAGNEGENVKKKPGRVRTVVRIVLLTILAVMTWRLIHDRIVDKQYRDAWERIVKLQEKDHSSPGQIEIRPAEVREAIGRDSTTGGPQAIDHYYREDFVWRRGLPWMRYYICVIYRNVKGEPRLHLPFQGCEPEARSLPLKEDVYWDRVEAAINAAKGGKTAPAAKEKTAEGSDAAPADKDP
jgi:hypothetical protein